MSQEQRKSAFGRGRGFLKRNDDKSNWRDKNSEPSSSLRTPGPFRDAPRRSESNIASSEGSSRSNRPFNSQRSLSFTYMANLLKEDPEKIILTLSRERQGLIQLVNTDKDLSPDLLVLIVDVLSKVSSSAFCESKHGILHSAFNEKFVKNLQNFVASLPLYDEDRKRRNIYFWRNPDEFFANLIQICENLVETTPTFACKTLPMLLKTLKVYVPVMEEEQGVEIQEDMKTKIDRMHLTLQDYIKENEEKKEVQVFIEPPDDFRSISVYPSAEEIVGKRGFVRENVIKGSYRNVEHYLDVQFRLLREDFVGPLRDGVTHYRSKTGQKLENVKVHKSVQFLNPETINEYFCLRLQFTRKNKKQNFENSKRFMFGALLCFTKNHFQSLLFGKVARRDVKDLEKGQIIVAFDERVNVDCDCDYLMVECGIYFEPYYHVLSVLKNMTEENFPLERYLIRVNPAVQAPEYLAHHTTYECQSVSFNPLEMWPNDNLYNFNESQMKAFKAAITQEICVIQGPPGTGKTYVGLKLAETLLNNMSAWYDRTPMLVICYTNHALDQFLEGLIPVTHNIVRVGGQSKNTTLQPFNLKNKRERDFSVTLKSREVQSCLKEIKDIGEKLQAIDYHNSVIAFRNFADVVPVYDCTWFYRMKDQDVINWLLKGANTTKRRFERDDRIQVLQMEAEFYNIGMEEGDVEEPIDFMEHIISASDNVFDVFNRQHLNNSFFLFKLGTMRDTLLKLEQDLNELRQNERPTLQELVKEEETASGLDELREIYQYATYYLQQAKDYAVEKIEFVGNPHRLKYEDRWKLYFYWLDLYKKELLENVARLEKKFPEVYKQYEELKEIEDVRAMKDALVVGMTTTSAARLRNSLQTLRNPIVIVEEAAEVLEAHIVTAITKHCKHLILIGDHKQLRPTTANFDMEKKYNLGISLFERMLINNIHCFTLNVQHRMRPEISSLIKPTIYDFLEDHPSTFNRPAINGIDNDLFFIDHNNPEEECDGSSKRNLHEVKFLIQLARHLVLNGYNPENITILAAYLGQFFAFLAERKGHGDLLAGMRIAVLDNYQGEESDIILLSLVRNNKENKIGFLKIENRVCVALSRARNGMYIMGNMDQLCAASQLWQKVRKSLADQDSLGSELPLRCQIHQDQITLVKCDSDFVRVPEGGCSKKCDADLKCGHKCTYLCHIQDRTHLNYKCQAECNKEICAKNKEHICKKMCFEDCGRCSYLVDRVLSCGHEIKLACFIDPETYSCQVKGWADLPCGHRAEKPCYCDVEDFRCPFKCEIQVQPCGHACDLQCHVRMDPDHQNYQCNKPCTRFMKDCTSEEDETHRCKKKCWEECPPCTVRVKKERFCHHVFEVSCNQDVDEVRCEKPCKEILQCGHPCVLKCGQTCLPCVKIVNKVSPVCGHTIKTKCSETPDRNLCKQKCPLKLTCGHPCTKRCNQECTSSCRVLVECQGMIASCGHEVTKIECHMTTSLTNPKELLPFCNTPCDHVLKCGHKCTGSCGECYQGRVHKRCTEKCGMLLVCNHECSFPCRQACRPCNKVCNYRCQHSTCKKPCGEVCTPCRERCMRRCQHQWCNKLCGDLCSIPPCSQPCPKKLKCGHPCVGFCGDPCPPLCMTCDAETLLEVFFGTEGEDSRFVLLNDCLHIMEHEGMEYWLTQDEFQIGVKVCPKCKTAIRSTQRYSDYTKRAMRDVAKVKQKTNGEKKEIHSQQQEIEFMARRLDAESGTLRQYCPSIKDLFTKIRNKVQRTKKGQFRSMNIFEVQSLKSKLQLTRHVIEICSKESINNSGEIFFPQVTFIASILLQDIDYISDQEIEDVCLEIKRLSRIVDYSCLTKVPQFQSYVTQARVRVLKPEIENRLFDCKKFTDESNELLKRQLQELNECLKSGIAISDEERSQIVQAMGFSKGHWFKCPNGHVYAIGECGGAMQESKCNECGAKIGGTSHRLLGDNAVATEMDGAVQDAFTARARDFRLNEIFMRDNNYL